MKMSLEKKIISLVAGFALLSLVLIFGIIWPTITRIRELERETYNLRVYLEKRYQKTINLRSSLKKIEQIKSETRIFPEHLFRAGEELKLITALEGIAAKNMVTQRIISSNVDKITNQRLNISLGISGAYHNVLRYLTDLENMNYFITVQLVQLSAAIEPTTHAEATSMNLDVSIYVVD